MSWISDNLDEIAPALLQAQKSIQGAKKDSENPFLKNKYADLKSVFKAVKAHLNDNGIVIIQGMGAVDGKTTMQTTLMHESGQYIAAEGFLPAIDPKGINAAQAMGSAISYMKRYQLQAITGCVGDGEDDDGNAAGSAEPAIVKDVTYWKDEADKNTNHIKNLKAWYAKHKDEITELPIKDQDSVNLYVKVLGEELEKVLKDKKDAEQIAQDAARGSGDGQ